MRICSGVAAQEGAKLMPAEGKSEAFVDRLAIDLATARLLHSPMPDVVERVRSELVAIRDVLVQLFPIAPSFLPAACSLAKARWISCQGIP